MTHDHQSGEKDQKWMPECLFSILRQQDTESVCEIGTRTTAVV